MQNAKPSCRIRPPDERSIANRTPRQHHMARAFAVGVFITLMLAAGGLAAQQVLMAPEVDLSFDSVEVAGQADAVTVDYELDANDWSWANDFGMDVWVGLYTSEALDAADEAEWQLQRVEHLGAKQGTVIFEDAVGAGADEVGLCLVVANVLGGKLAPGMGYVCETPMIVATDDGRLALEQTDVVVGLRFERNVADQPWFTAQLGFEQAMVRGAEIDETEGEFISYRAPAPPTEVRMAETRRGYDQRGYDQRGYGQRGYDQRGYDQRGYDQRGYDQRGYDQRGYDQHGYDWRGFDSFLSYYLYVSGYPSDFSFGRDRFRFDRDRFRVDRFRQRRLDRRRIFGPLDTFDAKFNQDMFGTHPEDVFYNSPVTPGYFGRDAFGRDLGNGFGVPPGQHQQLQNRGLGQPFD